MLSIQRAKEIRGQVTLPPNPDLFLLSLVLASVTGRAALVRPVEATPLVQEHINAFAHQCTVMIADGAALIAPSESPSPFVSLTYKELPWADLVVFLLLGAGRTVGFADLPQNRLLLWQKRAHTFGYILDTKVFGEGDEARTGLSLTPSDETKLAAGMPINIDETHTAAAIAIGRGIRLCVTIDASFQSPLRHVLSAFGLDLSVKQQTVTAPVDEDPIERRIRMMQQAFNKKKGDTASRPTVTVSGDFTRTLGLDTANIVLPGDDLLGAFLIAAKIFVQKGNLVIGNVPLESWAGAALSHARKMGCKPGLQSERTTSYGEEGSITLQKFEPVGRKSECSPLHMYTRHLPALVMIAAFAKGQSVFRGLDDLRNDSPDPIELLLSCVRLVGGRHGEMPDGMVIDGAKQMDGFDLQVDHGAAIQSACIAAALSSNGTSTINDESVLKRWPEFNTMLEGFCEFR